MRVAILPAGGTGLRMSNYRSTPKQLLRLNEGLVIDCALKAADLCRAWPHVIISPTDERVAWYAAGKAGMGSFSYAQSKLLASIYALKDVYREAQILYVMPDTVFFPLEACEEAMMKLDFPVVVGVFRTKTPHKLGMCRLGKAVLPSGTFPKTQFALIEVEDKPIKWDDDPIAWGFIAWREPFWECLVQAKEDHMTAALDAAIQRFSPLPTVWLEDYIDIGTREDYERALREGW